MNEQRFLPYREPRPRISWPSRLKAEEHFTRAIHRKLNALSNAQLKIKSPSSTKKQRRTSQKTVKLLTLELNYLLRSTGLKIEDNPPPKVTKEESLLIRFDFEGRNSPLKETDLSSAYRQALQKHQYLRTFTHFLSPLYHHTPAQYNLDAVPFWQTMKRFESFRRAAPFIQRELAAVNFPPRQLQQLNYYDLNHLLLTASIHEKRHLIPSRRRENIKMFIACYEPEFVRVMRLLKYSDREILRHINLMKNGRLDETMDAHHKNNVKDSRNFANISDANAFSNMMITFVSPLHRSLHRPFQLKVDSSVAFMGGYDPLLQIRRDPERERRYLEQQALQNRPRPARRSPLSFLISARRAQTYN